MFESIRRIFNENPQIAEQKRKATFFRTTAELKYLSKTHPSEFILRLPDQHLLIHIAGAARDSFLALGDGERARKFLEILQSDFWLKHNFEGTPEEHVAKAIAFINVNNGSPLEKEEPFLEFCRTNGVEVTRKDVEKQAILIRDGRKR